MEGRKILINITGSSGSLYAKAMANSLKNVYSHDNGKQNQSWKKKNKHKGFQGYQQD